MKRITTHRQFAETKPIIEEHDEHSCGGHCKHEPLAFAERKGPRSRVLTFAEKKVNFDAIEDFLNKQEGKMESDLRDLLKSEQETFIKNLNKALLEGDIQKIKSLELKRKPEYTKIVKSYLRDAYEKGKELASREMKVTLPTTPALDAKYIDLMADTIADRHMSQLETEAKQQVADALARGEAIAQTVAAANVNMLERIDQLVMDSSGIVVSGSFNNGRHRVFDTNSEIIYALQRSEVLDRRTCNYCLSIDGRVIRLDDPFAKVRQFHTHCRGIWVEIMMDETDKPDVGGIPDSLRNRFGGTVNDLIQPKKPLTKDNTLAQRYVQRRKTK